MKNICASAATLETVTDPDTAKRIRAIWRELTREQLIAQFPAVEAFARQCFTRPDIRLLRRMAVDIALETHGVEYLGISKRTGEWVYYCNAGDSYAATILFAGSRLWVGSWADMVESKSIRERQA